jgi:valyl-tRNA synthetase
LFRAPPAPSGARFVVPMPPPNVTGILTMGHMLGDTIQDLLARWHRMRGDAVLWVPGIDHAGLATQVEVRRRLVKEGVDVGALTPDQLRTHVETWKRQHEERILAQIRAGGFSVDWSRYRYTFDEGFVRATRLAFVQLYHAGLIYRGERIVNWDPKLRTAVSDLEVEHTEEPGELLYVRYDWADGSGGGIVVATVRPETIFGDIAVAVHPDDPRHASAVGRSVRVPLTERVVPVVSDVGVDREFGNGALKITPRHDLLDYEIFRRHPELTLPPSILDETGALEGEWVPERFRGIDRDPARAAVTESLTAAGLVERREIRPHSVGRSERTKAVIEPRLSTQWFVRLPALGGPVLEAVRAGTLRIHPDRWDRTFFRWMESLEDWCISRQIVWGHSIPVHYCRACSKETVEVDPPVKCAHCGSAELQADPDVLDAWFSSWMWPFAVLGWPESTGDLASYYPASVLVTGRDIMFFWVARMLMAGAFFTGRMPFADVYFTGMLRDETGRRMSKHLGNSPDPLEVVRERGADPMRFALVFPTPTDQDGPFGTPSLDGARNFLTKLWNVARFLQGHLPAGTEPPRTVPDLTGARLEDRWILSRWSATTRELEEALGAFEFTRAATALHGFLWHDVADRYLEFSKESLLGTHGPEATERTRRILLFVVERTLRQLHPFVPHVTEELWHALPHDGTMLELAPWPHSEEAPSDPEAEVAMTAVLESLRVYRNLRAETKTPTTERPEAWLRPSTPETRELLAREGPTVAHLARLGRLTMLAPEARAPVGAAVAVTPYGEHFLLGPPEGPDAREGLVKELDKLLGLLEKSKNKLADSGFRARAPANVVAEAEEKVRELTDRIARIQAKLDEVRPA